MCTAAYSDMLLPMMVDILQLNFDGSEGQLMKLTQELQQALMQDPSLAAGDCVVVVVDSELLVNAYELELPAVRMSISYLSYDC